jgi:Kef-type K+ transport system membrane component KefB
MQRLLALGLTVGVVWFVVGIAGGSTGAPRATALALGFALIAAALTGELFERLHLPRVSGYLVFGMVCGPYLGNIITRPMARDLQLVNGLAIALIALIAGLELNYRRLKPRLAAMAGFGAITIALMYAMLLPLLWLAWPWLPIYPEASGIARVALAVLLTTVIVSFSPTVTIAVIADTRSRGPLSEMALAVVVITDLALIVLFSVAMQFVRLTLGSDEADGAGLLVRLAWEILGSFAFGAVLGAVFAFYLRYVGLEQTIAVVVLCVLLAVLGPFLHFEPLLAALAAGLVIENIAQPSGDALKDAVERGALPILVVFFAAAGASLHLDALATVGLTAAAIAAVRLASIRASTAAAVRFSGVAPATGQMVWMALVSQAGVTLGLTILVAREFPDWGLKVQSLMVALIAMHELVGPVLFRAALSRAGEIGQMDDGETV